MVERLLAKEEVTGSSPASRSIFGFLVTNISCALFLQRGRYEASQGSRWEDEAGRSFVLRVAGFSLPGCCGL